jgi:hypothetical protein
LITFFPSKPLPAGEKVTIYVKSKIQQQDTLLQIKLVAGDESANQLLNPRLGRVRIALDGAASFGKNGQRGADGEDGQGRRLKMGSVGIQVGGRGGKGGDGEDGKTSIPVTVYADSLAALFVHSVSKCRFERNKPVSWEIGLRG